MNKDIERILSEEGVYVSSVVGSSMYPMLREGRDTVAITPVSGRLKKYDVALYRVGEKYVLHRVVRVLSDSYVCCGDNCVVLEKGICDGDVVGVLEKVWQGERELDLHSLRYRFYSRRKVLGFLPRKIWRRLYGAISRRIKKLFGKKK